MAGGGAERRTIDGAPGDEPVGGLALGRDQAVGLGVDHRRSVLLVLVLVAVLVSASTALVGPVTVFDLLVAALAHQLMRSHRHALLLPAAALIAGVALVGGQVVIERVLGWTRRWAP